MSQESEYQEYLDIAHLMKGDEWYTWTKFLEGRILQLSEKVLRQVHEKRFDEASCTEAIIGDIRKQLKGFRDRKKVLTDKFINKN